jgi:hypothetical protein
MKFKKGAFNSILPVKPVVINTVLSDTFHLSVGSAGLFTHFVRTLCYFYHRIHVTELPILFPNEFMFQNYTTKNPQYTEKWEIYAEVAREIMCRSSNLLKTESTFRDSCEYANIVNGVKKVLLVKEEEVKAQEKSINYNSNVTGGKKQ